jgi:hypothetical protein
MIDRISRRAAIFWSLAIAILAAALIALAAHGETGVSLASADRPDENLVTTAAGRMPMDEALALFRAGLPEVSRLEHGASDRGALIDQFVAAVEHGDTATARTLVMSRAEFAYLYFPHSAYARPPFRQDPSLTWFLLLQDSQKGITRVFNRFAGEPARIIDYSCAERPRRVGPLRLWSDCRATVRERRGERATLRLFGPIVEYGGRYKFLTYANDL